MSSEEGKMTVITVYALGSVRKDKKSAAPEATA
jgi:hypothetical protein